MKRWFIMIMVFALLFLAQSCSSDVGSITSQPTGSGVNTPGTEKSPSAFSVPVQPVPSPASGAEYASLSDYAMTTGLAASPEVAGAGETVELTSSFPFTGTLQIQGPQDRCVIRAMPIRNSGACRSAIPIYADHRFR